MSNIVNLKIGTKTVSWGKKCDSCAFNYAFGNKDENITGSYIQHGETITNFPANANLDTCLNWCYGKDA